MNWHKHLSMHTNLRFFNFVVKRLNNIVKSFSYANAPKRLGNRCGSDQKQFIFAQRATILRFTTWVSLSMWPGGLPWNVLLNIACLHEKGHFLSCPSIFILNFVSSPNLNGRQLWVMSLRTFRYGVHLFQGFWCIYETN